MNKFEDAHRGLPTPATSPRRGARGLIRVALLVAGVAFLVGCGKGKPTEAEESAAAPRPAPKEAPKKGKQKEAPPDKAGTPKDKASPPKAEPVSFTGSAAVVVEAYKENRVKADADFTGKRVRLDAVVNSVSRTKAGLPYVAFESVYNLTRRVDPTAAFVFPKERESEVATLREGDTVVIEGTVAGRTDDGINRGIRGYEFHIRLEDCRLISALRGGKRIFPAEK